MKMTNINNQKNTQNSTHKGYKVVKKERENKLFKETLKILNDLMSKEWYLEALIYCKWCRQIAKNRGEKCFKGLVWSAKT